MWCILIWSTIVVWCLAGLIAWGFDRGCEVYFNRSFEYKEKYSKFISLLIIVCLGGFALGVIIKSKYYKYGWRIWIV